MASATSSSYCITFEDVEKAAKRIDGVVERTPVLTSTSINQLCGDDRKLFFKVEALQHTGSFKFRGASNAIRLVLENERSESENQGEPTSLNVVTHSSGNHAQAVALAAKLASTDALPVKATIVMPFSTPVVKKDAVVSHGAKIVMVESTNEAREAEADRIQRETGALFVHPSEDPRVIAGQGTVGIELIQQMKDMGNLSPDVVIIPVGGGGLASGNCVSLRALLGDKVRIVLAEPKELDDAHRSFYSRNLLKHAPDNKLDSVADGLKTTLGPNTWPIVRDFANDIFTVSEKEILEGTLMIWQRLKICIEPSAGVGVAVAFSQQFQEKYPTSKYPNVGVVLCGGNVDVLKISTKMKDLGL